MNKYLFKKFSILINNIFFKMNLYFWEINYFDNFLNFIMEMKATSWEENID